MFGNLPYDFLVLAFHTVLRSILLATTSDQSRRLRRRRRLRRFFQRRRRCDEDAGCRTSRRRVAKRSRLRLLRRLRLRRRSPTKVRKSHKTLRNRLNSVCPKTRTILRKAPKVSCNLPQGTHHHHLTLRKNRRKPKIREKVHATSRWCYPLCTRRRARKCYRRKTLKNLKKKTRIFRCRNWTLEPRKKIRIKMVRDAPQPSEGRERLMNVKTTIQRMMHKKLLIHPTNAESFQ